ncbi:MAG: class I SAM-dependent DNA methyltransferase [Syntrophomonadaceae bacterium]|nr:class I SAM-dependent DNA methyltransferase [Syntrophomonadaceae bacterium]
MHYTSIENIHKVIDPLFLSELNQKFEDAKALKVVKTRNAKLDDLQREIANLKFLDPAAGSGNFLTETYLSLRRLENKIIKLKMGQQIVHGSIADPIQVSINQFYGIEINDFAVAVAKTALWIAESQMIRETEDIVHSSIDFLPLKSDANIFETNALEVDWKSLAPRDELNYIMGNPPFLGYSQQDEKQKEEMLNLFVDENGKPFKRAGKIDYVAAWYLQAAKMIKDTDICVAFVSTNSITQGEQVPVIWKPLFQDYGIQIIFAHRTFRWDSEATDKAHVHVVVIGFCHGNSGRQKYIIENGMLKKVSYINSYLMDAPNIFIESRKHPISNVPEMMTGNRPADGGHLIIEADEYDEFLRKEPEAIKYIKKLTGSAEYINNKRRYCLWLVDATPNQLRRMPEVMKRVEACRQDRLKGAADRQQLADTPTLFRETNNPNKYIIVPYTSSERRKYIPMGFLDQETIPTDGARIIPDGTIYHLGVLLSNVHMAWMRMVAGRLKSDYRYSKDIVYNNFPWPEPNATQKEKIEETARAILNARELYPDSSLADLYDDLIMPPELRKAHQENDRAVMEAYGFNWRTMTGTECVTELMELHQKLTR